MADRQKHQDFEEAEGFLRSDFNKLAAYRRSTWKSFSSCRDVLFHLTLVILGILCITGLIFILVDLRENICTAGHIPKVSVGSDYTGGFVPNGEPSIFTVFERSLPSPLFRSNARPWY